MQDEKKIGFATIEVLKIMITEINRGLIGIFDKLKSQDDIQRAFQFRLQRLESELKNRKEIPNEESS